MKNTSEGMGKFISESKSLVSKNFSLLISSVNGLEYIYLTGYLRDIR